MTGSDPAYKNIRFLESVAVQLRENEHGIQQHQFVLAFVEFENAFGILVGVLEKVTSGVQFCNPFSAQMRRNVRMIMQDARVFQSSSARDVANYGLS